MTRVLVPFGTRPEIVKLAPVVEALAGAGFSVRTVATGQHHDPCLTDAFYEALGMEPDERWSLEADEPARMGTMIARAWNELGVHRPDVVLVLGDTNTVPVFCLAARSHQVPLAHLEAGLRSFNPTSVEEVNRKVAAATASIHFAPTELAARFLGAEGVEPERVRVVGNPVVDVLRQLGVSPRPMPERAGVVVTAHRRTNVDDPTRLARLVEIVVRIAEEVGRVTFPVHPRTLARLRAASLLAELDRPGIALLPPLPYPDMLDVLAGSRLVVTDSGGLQEEASWLGVPTVVLRRSTPRWEGVANRTSVLVGLDVELAVGTARRMCSEAEQARVAAVPCPYGDGTTAAKVAETLAEPATAALLRLDEPDFVGRQPPA